MRDILILILLVTILFGEFEYKIIKSGSKSIELKESSSIAKKII
jgi:hypothetical protein